jgi:hypothetical protein
VVAARAGFGRPVEARRFACASTMLHALMVSREITFRKCGFGLQIVRA